MADQGLNNIGVTLPDKNNNNNKDGGGGDGGDKNAVTPSFHKHILKEDEK